MTPTPVPPPALEATLTDRAAVRDALYRLIATARLHLKAFVPRLVPDLWDDPAIAAALRELALGHDRSRIEVCVQDTAGVRGELVRLPELVDRLPSRCQMRLAARQDRELPEAFVLVDDRYYLRRATPATRIWTTHVEAPSQATHLAARFTEAWERAEGHPDLRRLTL